MEQGQNWNHDSLEQGSKETGADGYIEQRRPHLFQFQKVQEQGGCEIQEKLSEAQKYYQSK